MDDKTPAAATAEVLEPETGVGIVPAPPARLTSYRPEAWLGFHMRWNKWDRLKAQIRRLAFADTNWWKEAAVLLYGTAIGNFVSLFSQAVQGQTQHLILQALIGALFVVVGAICNVAYASVRRREKTSVEIVLEIVDDIETEYTRQ